MAANDFIPPSQPFRTVERVFDGPRRHGESVDLRYRMADGDRIADCRRIYWRGSHYDRLHALVEALRTQLHAA